MFFIQQFHTLKQLNAYELFSLKRTKDRKVFD